MKFLLYALISCGLINQAWAQNNNKNYINTMVQELKSDQCEANVSAAKTAQGQISDMGKVTVIALPNEGCGGGNNWGTAIQAFSEDGRQSNITTLASAEKMTIQNNRLLVVSVGYANTDAHCCPSLKEKHIFKIINGKLIETKP